jgi:hypothetical protein
MVSGRGFTHQGDTETYLRVFNNITYTTYENMNELFRLEYGFLLLTKLLNEANLNSRAYLFTIALIQVVLWVLCYKSYLDKQKLLLAIFLFISFFVSYNLGSNVMRQGIAIPISFLGMRLYFLKKYNLAILCFVIAYSFHHTSLLITIAVLLSYPSIRIKWYFIAFFILTFISGLNLSGPIIQLIPGLEADYSHILNATENYDVGFRLDFWLLTSFPLILFCLLNEAGKQKVDITFKAYLILASIFIIAFNIPYSDRIGMYPWMLMTILIPMFIGNYKYKILNSNVIAVIIIFIVGSLSLAIFPLMQLTYKFEEIF